MPTSHFTSDSTPVSRHSIASLALIGSFPRAVSGECLDAALTQIPAHGLSAEPFHFVGKILHRPASRLNGTTSAVGASPTTALT